VCSHSLLPSPPPPPLLLLPPLLPLLPLLLLRGVRGRLLATAAAADSGAGGAGLGSGLGSGGRRLTECRPMGTKHRRHVISVSASIVSLRRFVSSHPYLCSQAHSTVLSCSHSTNVSPCASQNSSADICVICLTFGT
jgi:hypothetical protein